MIPKDALYFMLSYALILLIGYGLIQWLSGGFFSKFLRVKASRGRLVLINVRSKLQHYFVLGRIEGGFLIYRDRESKGDKSNFPKRVPIDKDTKAFYRAYGVNCINVDEETNTIFETNLKGVEGFDAIKYSNIYERALTRPTLEEDKRIKIFLIIILIIVIIIILGLIIVYAKLGSIQNVISGLRGVSGGGVGGVNV